MPRTVKLSERFYEKFGHDLVDELVNWFNETDTAYRTELRELNDVNFARFDAKLEQRLAEFGAGLRLEIGAVGAAVAQFEANVEQRRALSDAKWEQRLAQSDTSWEHRLGELRAQLEAEGKTLMRWMVGLWISAIGLLVGVIFAGLHFLPVARS